MDSESSPGSSGHRLGEFLRREATESAVRPVAVVVEAPGRDRADRVGQAHKPARVQALVAELPVEALDEGVLHGLARLDEAQLDASLVGPLVQQPARELRSVVQYQRLGRTPALDHPIEDARHACRWDRPTDLDRERLAREVVYNVERSKGPCIGQGVGHEVDRPALVGPLGPGNGPPRSSRNLLPPSSPYGEGLFSVNAIDALAVDPPAFTAEHVVDPPVAEAAALLGPCQDPLPQARIVGS